jgi:hypothetical protein
MISKYHETGYSCKKNACSLLKISVGVAILLDNEKIVLAQIKKMLLIHLDFALNA